MGRRSKTFIYLDSLQIFCFTSWRSLCWHQEDDELIRVLARRQEALQNDEGIASTVSQVGHAEQSHERREKGIGREEDVRNERKEATITSTAQ